MFTALVPNYHENGWHPLDPGKAFKWIHDTVFNECVMIVENEAGEIVATMGLNAFQYPWCNAEGWEEVWTYVRPEYRNGGRAMRMLLAEARALGKATDADVIVRQFLPIAEARRSAFRRIGETMDYRPRGWTFLIHERKV